MSGNEDQYTYWNEVAGPKWVASQDKLDRLMVPLSEALLQIAAPGSGERVLDIGCGCGELALQVAEKVGEAGAVVGIDLSQPMLTYAAARADALPAAQRAKVEWRHADAMTTAFEPSFDLLISRFGVMFFADKRRAFANLRKAVAPQGRIAFLTWRGRDEVEWMRTPLDWIAPALPPSENTDGRVGPFGLADGEGTRHLLEEAGFWDVVAEPLDRSLVIGETVEESLAMLSMSGPAGALMRDAEPQLRDEAAALMRREIERHSHNGRLELRGACWVYRGFADPSSRT